MNVALIIFAATYVVIAVQNIPRVHINRPAGALLGAVAMVLFGVITLEEAYAAIDFNTLLFILGMMIVVAYVELSGFFEVAESFILARAGTASALLLSVVLSSGVFSSLFMNDTICLLFTPMVLRITRRAGLNPVPYLIALATSANVGSVMTIIGNPQNMLIGLYSGIPFLEFFRVLAPVGAGGLLVNFAVIRMIYRRDVAGRRISAAPAREPRPIQRELLAVSIGGMVLLLLFLCLGYNPPAAAITFACVLILAGATKPRKALEEVDWSLLLFFAALFVVMRAAEKAGIAEPIVSCFGRYEGAGVFGRVVNLSAGTAIVSNIVSNVPAVMLVAHVVRHLAASKLFWLTLAMSSTLAGNLTIIGSVANIIVFETARDDVAVSFLDYVKVGLPVTLATLFWGVIVIWLAA